jgi:antitoxin component of RelBE/YafQ-DinJ toxin-antitoxin module
MEKSDLARIRLTPAEKEAFQRAADLAGLSLSAWIRIVLRNAAARDLDAAGIPVSFFQSSGNLAA